MNLHPPLSSAPAVLLTTGFALEVAGRLARVRMLRISGRLLLVLGAGALAVGYISGIFAEEQLSPHTLSEKRALLDGHEGWARLAALFAFVPLLFLLLHGSAAENAKGHSPATRRLFSLLFLVSYLFLVIFTAYASWLGGQLVFRHGIGIAREVR